MNTGSFFDTTPLQMAPPKQQSQASEHPSQSTYDNTQSQDTMLVHGVKETPHPKYMPVDQRKDSHVITISHSTHAKSQPYPVQPPTHEQQPQFQEVVDAPLHSTTVQLSANNHTSSHVVTISRIKHVRRYKR